MQRPDVLVQLGYIWRHVLAVKRPFSGTFNGRNMWPDITQLYQYIWSLRMLCIDGTNPVNRIDCFIINVCNIYCFSTATMVARKRFIVTLYVHCLFGLKCNINQPLYHVSRDACNSCRCTVLYSVFGSNLHTSWNVVVQTFCDKPHDKMWGKIIP